MYKQSIQIHLNLIKSIHTRLILRMVQRDNLNHHQLTFSHLFATLTKSIHYQEHFIHLRRALTLSTLPRGGHQLSHIAGVVVVFVVSTQLAHRR